MSKLFCHMCFKTIREGGHSICSCPIEHCTTVVAPFEWEYMFVLCDECKVKLDEAFSIFPKDLLKWIDKMEKEYE